MSTTFAPLPSAAAVRPASADPADVRLAACSAVVLKMAEFVAVVTMYFDEVSPRRLHGDAASRDTS